VPASISAALRNQLERAAGAYRAHCWPAHQKANAAWIAELHPRLAANGAAIGKRLSEVYDEPWPSDIFVDVVTYSNWAGAYTTDHQITVDSVNPDYQENSALEMIFHEASHTIDDGIIRQLSSAFRKFNSDQPRGLEHALIFFTAGALTKAELRASDPNYVPYAERLGIYKRVPFWAEDEHLFQQYWQPYLEGKSSRDAAMESIARAIVGEDTKASGEKNPHEDAAAAIRAVLDEQVAAWNRGDLDAFMQGYAKLPELSFYSGATVTSGWEQTLQRYRAKYQSGGNQMGKLTFSDLEIHVLAPDAAWVGGRWQLEMTDGKRPGGLFTLIFRKLPDGWKIVHDHTSS
jgi:ketosteroid isomerase-like protein